MHLKHQIKQDQMTRIFILLVFFMALGCVDQSLHLEVKELKEQLTETQVKIKNLQLQVEEEGQLIHLVLFKMKSGINQKEFGREIQKLRGIEVVRGLQYGSFADLGDKRALAEYDMMMEVSFDSREHYEKYQIHPIHTSLKEAVTPMLAGPPATYDYTKTGQ